MNELKHYGLVISKVEDPQAYVLGGLTSLPKVVLQTKGDWSSFLPVYEPQFGGSFDSCGCTIWGTLNIYETLLKRIEGKEYNFSERFNYILGHIRPPGADPHESCENIRHNSVIPQEKLPMTQSFEEFVRPDPMLKEFELLAQKFPYELKHEYVWKGGVSKEARTELIRECLKYSPLGVSVTAWFLENGVYVDRGLPNTHWCELYGEEPGKGWLIFDSYDQSKKILSYDHNIQIAKRFMLVKKEQPRNWWLDIIKRLFKWN